MNKCCSPGSGKPEKPQTQATGGSCCDTAAKSRVDWLLWGSLAIVSLSYAGYWLVSPEQLPHWLHAFTSGAAELVHSMWWGVLAGAFFVGLLAHIPREMVISMLGRGGSKRGLLRATAAGLFFDLCSHGILMVGMQLYKRGASLGQVFAFLIASPWNSLSLTVILVALIGLKWTLLFVLLSVVIALVAGYLADLLVRRGRLPENPNTTDLPEDYRWFPAMKALWRESEFSLAGFGRMLLDGIKGSQMVIRWLLFGIVLALLVRAFVDPELFASLFGPTLLGLAATLIGATILEVCSEGATPLAADIFSRANAPGNAFTFLMAGVSTDYTEIMSLRDTTGKWRIALAMPLLTLPQILLLGWIMNQAV